MTDTTFVLVPGAGGGPWFWHRVAPLLEARGHAVLLPDVPTTDPEAGLREHADAIVDAARDRGEVVLVAQSMAGFTAPLACDRLDVALLVLLCPMIPAPGETPGGWWESSGQIAARRADDLRAGRDPDRPFDDRELFFHDVPDDVTEAAFAGGDQHPADKPFGEVRELFFHDVPDDVTEAAFAGGDQHPADKPFGEVWPLDAWPDVPTRVVAGARDRLFPLDFVTRLARERLAVAADAVDAGHCAALAKPEALAERLEALWLEQAAVPR